MRIISIWCIIIDRPPKSSFLNVFADHFSLISLDEGYFKGQGSFRDENASSAKNISFNRDPPCLSTWDPWLFFVLQKLHLVELEEFRDWKKCFLLMSPFELQLSLILHWIIQVKMNELNSQVTLQISSTLGWSAWVCSINYFLSLTFVYGFDIQSRNRLLFAREQVKGRYREISYYWGCFRLFNYECVTVEKRK